MSVHIKPLPALEFPQAELHQLGLYMAKSAQFTYASTDATAMFTIPANTQIVAIGATIDTAFAGIANGDRISVGDGTNYLFTLKGPFLTVTTNPYMQLCLVNKTSATTLYFNVDLDASASAGAITFYLVFRLASNKEDWLVRLAGT